MILCWWSQLPKLIIRILKQKTDSSEKINGGGRWDRIDRRRGIWVINQWYLDVWVWLLCWLISGRWRRPSNQLQSQLNRRQLIVSWRKVKPLHQWQSPLKHTGLCWWQICSVSHLRLKPIAACKVKYFMRLPAWEVMLAQPLVNINNYNG